MTATWPLTKTKRYLPIQLLGQGGMGAVYEVEDSETNGRLALKLMLNADARRLLRFKQEFRIMAEFHHRNLVRLFDLGYEDQRWFFTMELVDGQTLIEALRLDTQVEEDAEFAPTTLTPEQVEAGLFGDSGSPDTATQSGTSRPRADAPSCDLDAFIVVIGQVLDALQFLHARGVVHRDLKPGNILVDVDGVVRVLDFGLASRVDRSVNISRDGAVVGTVAYMSPEQCCGSDAGPASDLYSLGCIMFQLLTGQLPFGGSYSEAVQRRLTQNPPRVSDHVGGVPAVIDDVCHQLLARDPSDRPTIAQVRQALGLDQQTSDSASGSSGGSDERRLTGPRLFVGRRQERKELRRRLEQAASGAPQLAMISGQSGLGKSALANMMVEWARARGFMCFTGRCYQRERVPFVAFDRAVDAIILSMARWPRARIAPVREAIGRLRRMFPAFGLLLPGGSSQLLESDGDIDPRQLSRRAIDAFSELLAFLQEQAPVLLVLDDLQWLNEESAALLEALVASAAGRLCILALFRPEGIQERHPMRRLWERARQAPSMARIELQPLAPDEAVELVGAVAGVRLDQTTSEALARQAEGNPFLTLQMADYLARNNDQLQLDNADQSPLAFDVDEILRGRIEALSPRAESVLSLAAAAGGQVSTRLLAEASQLAVEDFDMAIGELMALRLCKALPPTLHESRPGESHDDSEREIAQVDLYHDRLRMTAYQRLSAERRQELHRALAMAVEAQPGGVPLDVDALVHHFTEAGDRGKLRGYALAAAEQAISKLAFHRAAQLLHIVLRDPEPDTEPLALAARWERAAQLGEYSAQIHEAHDDYEQALALWLRAPATTPERDASMLRIYGRLGELRLIMGRIRAGCDAYGKGLALLGLPFGRSRRSHLATVIGLFARLQLRGLSPLRRRKPRPATPFVREHIQFYDTLMRVMPPMWPTIAVEIGLRFELLSQEVDDKQFLQRALASRAGIPVFVARATRRSMALVRRSLDEAEQLARTYDVPLGMEVVQMYRALAWLPRDMGRARRLNEVAQEGLQRQGMGDYHYGALARVMHLVILAVKGDNQAALEAIDSELSYRYPNFINQTLALSIQARILCQLGRSDEAEAAASRMEAMLEDKPFTALNVALVQSRGAVFAARGHYEQALDEMNRFEHEHRDALQTSNRVVLGNWHEVALEAAIGLARRGRLDERRERARARSRARWLLREGVLDTEVYGYLSLALLAHAEGRHAIARKRLTRALDLSTSNTHPYRRWACLELAGELDMLTSELETEVSDLAVHGFVRPARWYRSADQLPA